MKRIDTKESAASIAASSQTFFEPSPTLLWSSWPMKWWVDSMTPFWPSNGDSRCVHMCFSLPFCNTNPFVAFFVHSRCFFKWDVSFFFCPFMYKRFWYFVLCSLKRCSIHYFIMKKWWIMLLFKNKRENRVQVHAFFLNISSLFSKNNPKNCLKNDELFQCWVAQCSFISYYCVIPSTKSCSLFMRNSND